jgi:hypothetical protein
MSIFNFIETFFFISLGITFVLISLLVYHFRQRIIVLESKNDTMFEIINNIVKELTNIRNSILYMNPDSAKLIETSNLLQQQYNYRQFDDNQPEQPIQHYVVDNDDTDNVDTDEESDSDTDEESDEDSNDDIQNDNDDSDDDADDDDDDDDENEDNDIQNVENIEKIVVSLEPDDTPPVKIVNVNIETNTIEEINDLANEDTVSLEEDQIVELDVNAETVIVHKVDEIPTENTVEEFHIKKNKNTDLYKNFNTNQLKQLVITKGLSTNPSKLKKYELLELLENSD